MKRVLKKVLEELVKDTPNLSYIRGMIEVLVEDDEVVVNSTHLPIDIPKWVVNNSTPVLDESKILDSMAKANIAQVMENVAKAND